MVDILKQKLLPLLTFLVFFAIIELLTFRTMGLGNAPEHVILDFTLAGGLGVFIFLFRSNVWTIIYLSFWMLSFIFLYLINTTMYKIYGDIFSLDKLTLIKEAKQVFEWNFLDLKDVIISIVLFLCFIAVNYYILFFRTPKKAIQKRKLKFSVNRFWLFIISFLIFGGVFYVSSSAVSQDISINGEKFTQTFYVTTLKKSAFQYYGMLSFYYEDIDANYNNSTTGPDDSSAPVDPAAYSNYHGLLAGDNVVMIMLESGQEMGINKYLTPNLYNIRENGVYFAQNYSINKTNVSEQIGITGSYPTNTFNYSTDTYTFPFSVPNLLGSNYTTSFFHDNNPDFYGRGKLMPELGFQNLYLHDDLFPETLPNWNGNWSWYGDYTLDSTTVERILPHIAPAGKPFYSFWTTLSTHGPYDENPRDNNALFQSKGYYAEIDAAEAAGEWVNPLQNDSAEAFEFKYYQAAMIDLDTAVGKIIDYLKEKNLLNNTLLVLYGDHEVYYNDLVFNVNGIPADENYKMDPLYKTIMYMYNPTLNASVRKDYGSGEIDTFTSPYIVAPTVLDLLGIHYNPDDYSNYSVFSSEYIPLFYSHQLNSLFDNEIYTSDAQTVQYNAHGADQTYIDDFFTKVQELLNRQNVINNLYDQNKV